jgi:pyruvate formate-lyase/glycerol dehydratase family glycyl radical enzyme
MSSLMEARRRRERRVERLKKRFFSSKFYVDSERALIITHVYSETEGEPQVVRRAKALSEICRRVGVHIFPDELIVGATASRPRSTHVFPEFSVHWVEEELDEFETRAQDKFVVPEKVKEELRSIFPYWKGKTVWDCAVNILPDDTRDLVMQGKHSGAHPWSGFAEALGHYLPDYTFVMDKGYRAIRKEAEERMRGIDIGSGAGEEVRANLEKYHFLKAVAIVSDAAIILSKRYSQEAKKLAGDEKDPERKQELEEISKVCAVCLERPVKSFHEAVQALWFIQLISQHLEVNGASQGIGPFDQFMYPYYEEDSRAGRANEEEILDLIECFYVKLAEEVILRNKSRSSDISNFSIGQHIDLGGQNPDGSDKTNKLSWLCLKAQGDLGLIQPDMSVKWHKNMDDEFFLESCRVIRKVNAEPQLINDAAYRESVKSRGYTDAEAWDYSMYGCNELSVTGTTGPYIAVFSSPVKSLELALNNGRCMLCGRRIGPETGDPSNFKTYDDLIEAFLVQIEFLMKYVSHVNAVQGIAHSRLIPMPFASTLMPTCLERAKEINEGGVDYYYSKSNLIGLGTLADSLAAAKKLVFEEKRISLSELIRALKNNFKGEEILRQTLLNKAPKYGNDDDYVDSIAVECLKLWIKMQERYRDVRGGKLKLSYWPGYISNTAHVSIGREIAATPDGRFSMAPLSDNLSPSQARDINGITASLKSVAKLRLNRHNSAVHNVKFHPSAIAGEENIKRFADAAKTYFELGGVQLQFNVLSNDVLKDAQHNPEKHRDLVVRVAGYSAVFVELNRKVQEDIILRTDFTKV